MKRALGLLGALLVIVVAGLWLMFGDDKAQTAATPSRPSTASTKTETREFVHANWDSRVPAKPAEKAKPEAKPTRFEGVEIVELQRPPESEAGR